MNKKIFAILIGVRNRHLFMIDFVLLSLTPLAAMLLRIESAGMLEELASPLALFTAVALMLKLTVFRVMNFYDRYWKYASVDEIIVLALGTLTSWCLTILVFFMVLKPLALLPQSFPNSVPLIDGMLTMVLVGGLRFGIRLMYVMGERSGGGVDDQRVLIVGAGLTGSMIVKELRSNSRLAMKPVGFVDDDPAKQNMIIHEVRVMGKLSDIPDLVRAHEIDEVVIAMPTVSGKTIRDVVEKCVVLGVKSKTIPGIFEILSGSAVAQLRDVDIEDLLRRDIVKIDEENVEHFIQGTKVMVTGAGGSIGSELCRQIAKYRPKELVMLGHGENSIFQIANEMRTKHGVIAESITYKTVIADIRDRERMIHVMEEYRPQIVFHAAAHKHVELMETNMSDAVTNNILGTKILIDLAGAFGVEKFVMISSDKAVNPMCVMGVTKRVAELVVRDAAVRNSKPFVIVRFGNVLGSRGSIVPILKKQINAGGPVTITHPDVSRFFMTIPEAVQLVLQAGAMGTCGETFVLDMGRPVKIVELARDLIRLSGLAEGKDIDIVYTGLKNGEKMHEELFYQNERAERSDHDKIFICKNGHSTLASNVFRDIIDDLVRAAKSGSFAQTQELLKKIVIQYRTGVDESGQNGALPASPLRTLQNGSVPAYAQPAPLEGRRNASPSKTPGNRMDVK
ncbi:MAG TPA: nucleoside-diphosphate sugar epimerase/dehydratase [Bacteroidota bacterium]|nr:nucleoside-diphosphate sugar epimerase/dehydratase [Bacteroidota bacterium]